MFYQSEWMRSKTPMIVYAGEDVEQGEHSSTADGSSNLHSHFGNKYGISQKIGTQSTSGPSNTILGHIPKECTLIPQGYLLNCVHSSIIRNSQNWETT